MTPRRRLLSVFSCTAPQAEQTDGGCEKQGGTRKRDRRHWRGRDHEIQACEEGSLGSVNELGVEGEVPEIIRPDNRPQYSIHNQRFH